MARDETKLTFILGAARAGKSSFALRLAKERAGEAGVCFIATAQALDEDMTKRIACHRAERPAQWNTIEEPYQLDAALLRARKSELVIVDCLTLFVSNWLLRFENEHQCEQMLRNISEAFLETVKTQRRNVICVSNEVGLGVVPETRMGRTFRDLLGRVNQQFAEAADEVYLLVAGLPLRLKPNH